MNEVARLIATLSTHKELQEVSSALHNRFKELDRAELAKGGFLSEHNQCMYCGVEFEYRHPFENDHCEVCKPCYERRRGESGMKAFRITAPPPEDFEPRTL